MGSQRFGVPKRNTYATFLLTLRSLWAPSDFVFDKTRFSAPNRLREIGVVWLRLAWFGSGKSLPQRPKLPKASQSPPKGSPRVPQSLPESPKASPKPHYSTFSISARKSAVLSALFVNFSSTVRHFFDFGSPKCCTVGTFW